MRKFFVKPCKVSGEIRVPPSKSHTLRAILFGTLSTGESTIYNYLQSPDSDAMIEACRSLGATISKEKDRLTILGVEGKIRGSEDVINAGNSGIVLRFISAVAALGTQAIVITGDHSIRHQRPMQPLLESLQTLGVEAISTKEDGFAPLIIRGEMRPGKTTVIGSDSQHVSALLIASQFSEGPTEIVVINPGEKPWIDLTLHWFDLLSLPYERKGYEWYRIPGQAKLSGFEYTVPTDLSSLSFPIGAALVTDSELTLLGVDLDDPQGDKELISALETMGANFEIDAKKKQLTVKKGNGLKGVKIDINNFIDAIAIFATISCFAEGRTEIVNATVAREKECDRIRCIAQELKKMGAHIEETEDGLIVEGRALRRARLNSHNDHRMAMSLAIAAFGAKGESVIENTSCISKTYSTFVQDFQAIHADISEGL